jgi:phosphohistidine phosphatase SixA
VNSTSEIQLCMLRHAHAGDPMKWQGPDDVRPLTEKGRSQSQRLGTFLAVAGFHPDAILSSPKTRALETATLVAAALGLKVGIAEDLGGPLDLATLDGLLQSAGDPVRPLLVGHDPEFSTLASELAGVPCLPMRKAAIIRIDVVRPLRAGQGTIRWLVPPDLLGSEG